MKKTLKNLLKNRRLLIGLGAVILVIAIGVVLRLTVFKPAPKIVYDVAVMVRSQNNKDPVEDRKNSLKAGDVLVVQKENHGWSKNERISYLIIKMELTDEQKQKLTSAEEREIEFDELSKEEQSRIEEEKKRAKEEDREYFEEPRRETLRARAYKIDFDKLRKYPEFENFQAINLMKGQPFGSDMVFDWGIVDKKEKVGK